MADYSGATCYIVKRLIELIIYMEDSRLQRHRAGQTGQIGGSRGGQREPSRAISEASRQFSGS